MQTILTDAQTLYGLRHQYPIWFLMLLVLLGGAWYWRSELYDGVKRLFAPTERTPISSNRVGDNNNGNIYNNCRFYITQSNVQLAPEHPSKAVHRIELTGCGRDNIKETSYENEGT